MRSRTTEEFWTAFRNLPKDHQEHAREVFQLWRSNPFHPSLHFKSIAGQKRLVSARIGRGWRVVGARYGDLVVWFWIGPHHEYDKLIGRR